ncbi:M20 family peptidase [soil metagenome]
MFKKILLVVVFILLALAAVLLFNTFRFESKQLPVEASIAPEISPAALKHFQQAIQFKTVSNGDSSLFDSTHFISFHAFLATAYPQVHESMTREIVAGYSLLYKWEGKNPSLKPIILMAHQDVVPIEAGTKSMWSVDPFAGEIKDDFIWGRGTADDKINLISIMESAEKLLTENFQPDRTIYLAFGHDEELGGEGAQAIAALLKSRNVTADLVLDEGGIVTRDKIPGLTKPVALIGTSEKGYLSLELTAQVNGGHSSMPASETSIDILAKALIRLREHPFDATFSESTEGFMEHIGPEMPFIQKIIFANRWLFKSVIVGIYEKSGSGNAVVRTTIAPTIIHAGVKDNVIPTIAKATVNFRLLPGDSTSRVIEKVKQTINDDRITVNPFNNFIGEPTGVTSENSFGYKKIDMIAKKTFANTVTTPFLMIGGTDSRHFSAISDGIIKFSPMFDPIGFHGIDERVSLEGYRTTLWFYEQLMRDTQ